ncbi:hypothetical protein F5887DRAFT_941061 [Amanita rubescens]|nr:hypothetical protein F5887DRAFT_941061 [Amanita rubescens]
MDSLDDLLQQRLAQLKSIADRRNELLREMYHMMRRRVSAGHAFALTDQHEEQDLHLFLQRFDLSKDPESGSIVNLGENELFAHENEQETQREEISVVSPVVLVVDESEEQVDARGGSPAEQVQPASRPNVVLTQFHPRHVPEDESDDELDLFGSYHRKPAPQESETIQELATTSPEVVIVDDDLADGEGDIDNEDVPESDAFHVVEDTTIDQMDVDQDVDKNQIGEAIEADRMSVDQRDIAEDQRQSPLELDEGGHLSDTSEDALSAISKDVDDGMDTQLDLGPKIQFKAPIFPESSYPEPLYLMPNKAPRPIFVLGAIAPLKAYNFAFDSEINVPPSKEAESPPATLLRSGTHAKYSLPPLKSLPAEYSRKNKSKQRKREKEREKNDAKRDTNDWTPMGLNKWAATINANPVWKKVSRATKCLSSREWAVAMAELRLIRAVDRIESLKDAGRWSFRQPKKQRGVGGLVKTHWDYLLDEVKWMRVDFREERKWKMALAYNLSTSVLEWHAAGSWNERFAKGITVRWKRPLPVDKMDLGECLQGESMQSEVYQQHEMQKTSLLGLDYGSDDDDDEEQDREVIDALQPSTLLEDALDTPTGVPDAEDVSMVAQLKKEETEDQSALGESGAPVLDSQDTPHSDASSANNDNNGVPGLKSTSNDPVWGSSSISQPGDRDVCVGMAKLGSKATIYAPVRERVAHSDEQKLFLSLADLHLEDPSVVQSLESKDEGLFPPAELSTVFPDLQPYEMLDVAPAIILATVEGRKKSERRSDKDDPNKRTEDTTYSKLYPASRFMRTRPTLLGPLLPSKRWKDGSWDPIEEAPIVADADGVAKTSEDNSNELFENRANNAAAAFWQAAAMKGGDPRRKSSDYVWSPNDDALLKSCIDKYPYNWYLIAECFNASRVTISTDKRSPRDCLERWREKWGSELRLRQAEANATPTGGDGSPSTSQNQMTTRGIKRQAGTSIASPGNGIPAPGTEPRKRRRHLLVQDTIRKYTKKRIETLQKANAQRKPSIIHETHLQYAKLPKLSPAELIRLKAERDAREHQELLARKVIQSRLSQQVSLFCVLYRLGSPIAGFSDTSAATDAADTAATIPAPTAGDTTATTGVCAQFNNTTAKHWNVDNADTTAGQHFAAATNRSGACHS